VTRHTVVGSALLLVTGDAEFHGVLDRSGSHGHLRNVAMTCGAIDFRTDVRGMIEADVRFLYPAPDALPGDIVTVVVITFHLLNFRTIRRGGRMAAPAGPDIGY